MKLKTLITTTAVLMAVAFTTLSCNNTNTPNKEPNKLDLICGVEDPLVELDWLNQIVNGYRQDSINGNMRTVRIYKCPYKNSNITEIGILIQTDLTDFGVYDLYNCQGDILCSFGGNSGYPSCMASIDLYRSTLLYQMLFDLPTGMQSTSVWRSTYGGDTITITIVPQENKMYESVIKTSNSNLVFFDGLVTEYVMEGNVMKFLDNGSNITFRLYMPAVDCMQMTCAGIRPNYPDNTVYNYTFKRIEP